MVRSEESSNVPMLTYVTAQPSCWAARNGYLYTIDNEEEEK